MGPTSSRSRRPRRSPPSTWPSSGRPSRSWRRWRSVPSSLLFSKSQEPTQPQNCSQLNLEKNLDRSANPLNPNNLVGTKVANQQNPELPSTSPTSPLEELFGSS